MTQYRGLERDVMPLSGLNEEPVHLNKARVQEMSVEQRWMETIEHRWEQRKEREASGFYEPSAWVSK